MSVNPSYDFCRSIRLADELDVVFLVDVVGNGFGVTVVYPKDDGSLDYRQLPGVYETRSEALRQVEDRPLDLILQVE